MISPLKQHPERDVIRAYLAAAWRRGVLGHLMRRTVRKRWGIAVDEATVRRWAQALTGLYRKPGRPRSARTRLAPLADPCAPFDPRWLETGRKG